MRRSGRNSGDQILRELVTANRQLNLVRAKTFFGKLRWDPGCHRPLLRKDAFSLPNSIRPTKQLATLCIDQRMGKILWRTVAPAEIEKVHEMSSPAAPTPATDGERVYVYFGSYGLVSYDFDGKLLWERRLPLPQNIYGAVASPIVAGDLLVLNHQGKDAYLLAVNWQHDGIDEIVVLGGDFEPNQRLMAYNLADGAERWRVAGLPPCGKSRSVIGGDMVFFAAPDIILDVEAETSPAIDLLERSDTPGQTIWVCLASRANVRRRRPWPLRLTEC